MTFHHVLDRRAVEMRGITAFESGGGLEALKALVLEVKGAGNYTNGIGGCLLPSSKDVSEPRQAIPQLPLVMGECKCRLPFAFASCCGAYGKLVVICRKFGRKRTTANQEIRSAAQGVATKLCPEFDLRQGASSGALRQFLVKISSNIDSVKKCAEAVAWGAGEAKTNFAYLRTDLDPSKRLSAELKTLTVIRFWVSPGWGRWTIAFRFDEICFYPANDGACVA